MALPILEVTFSTGENSNQRVRWKPYDTEPARLWMYLLTRSYENHTEYVLDDTEATFCRTQEEATEHWGFVKNGLAQLGHHNADTKMSELNVVSGTKILRDLFDLFYRTEDSQERADLISDLIDGIKPVLFYLHNRGHALGHIYHRPDITMIDDFRESWYKYFTMNTQVGDLYATVLYESYPWQNLAMARDAKEFLKIANTPALGVATKLTSGFTAHWGHDLNPVAAHLDLVLEENEDLLKQTQVGFSRQQAAERAGRLPVAQLIGHWDYDTLRKFKKITKVELI